MDPINTKLLRQLLRTMERIERQAVSAKPVQQHKNSTCSDESADQEQAKPRPEITVHAIAEPGDAQTRQNEAHRKSTYSFQQKSLRVQWCLAWVTLLAFGAAAYYGYVATQQRDLMSRTLDAQERAYLAAGDPTQSEVGPMATISIPIVNYGHVSADHELFIVWYTHGPRSAPYAAFKHERFDVRRETPIAPGPAGYALKLTPPHMSPADLSKVAAGTLIEILKVSVQYETGFGHTDIFGICLGYAPYPEGHWKACGRTTDYIDLGTEKPTKKQ